VDVKPNAGIFLNFDVQFSTERALPAVLSEFCYSLKGKSLTFIGYNRHLNLRFYEAFSQEVEIGMKMGVTAPVRKWQKD